MEHVVGHTVGRCKITLKTNRTNRLTHLPFRQACCWWGQSNSSYSPYFFSFDSFDGEEVLNVDKRDFNYLFSISSHLTYLSRFCSRKNTKISVEWVRFGSRFLWSSTSYLSNRIPVQFLRHSISVEMLAHTKYVISSPVLVLWAYIVEPGTGIKEIKCLNLSVTDPPAFLIQC